MRMESREFCIVLFEKWMEYIKISEVNRIHPNMIKVSLAFSFQNPLSPLGGLSLFNAMLHGLFEMSNLSQIDTDAYEIGFPCRNLYDMVRFFQFYFQHCLIVQRNIIMYSGW